MVKKAAKNIQYIFFALVFLLVLTALVIYRGDVSKGIYRGISYSMSILIPSIMPFMFVSGLFSALPCSAVLCKIVSPITRYVFKLPECTAPAIIFGLTCGYPVGAKLSAELLKREQITPDEAGRLLIFTMNPGIPFTILFLGSVILRSTTQGAVIYCCITVGSVLLGVITGLTKKAPAKNKLSAKEENIFSALKMSADSTIRACLNMSFYIIVFWGFMALLHKSGVFQFIVKNINFPFTSDLQRAGLLSFFFEVTGGISDCCTLKLPLIIYVLGLSFGGVCIHLQLFSFFSMPPVKYTRFLLFRIVHCLLSGLCFRLTGLAAPQAVAAISTSDSPIFQGMRGNFVGSVCLLILFVTYVLISQKETVVKKIKR